MVTAIIQSVPITITVQDQSPITITISATSPIIIPPGGTTGQVLVKISNADYDIGWATLP